MQNGRTKCEVETAIRNAVIEFEQEFMGRGPMDVKAFTLKDLILVRLKGVLTPAERQPAKGENGVEMIKAMRQNLITQGHDKLCTQMTDITGAIVSGLFTDIDTQIGERVIVFSPDQDLESQIR